MKYVIGALQWKLPRAPVPFNPALTRDLQTTVCGSNPVREVISSARKDILLLRSEIPSGMCAKLRTAAASNNRVHMPWSLYYCLFAPHIKQMFARRCLHIRATYKTDVFENLGGDNCPVAPLSLRAWFQACDRSWWQRDLTIVVCGSWQDEVNPVKIWSEKIWLWADSAENKDKVFFNRFTLPDDNNTWFDFNRSSINTMITP